MKLEPNAADVRLSTRRLEETKNSMHAQRYPRTGEYIAVKCWPVFRRLD